MSGARLAVATDFRRVPGEPRLEAIGITKDFASLRANDHIDFAIKPGEIQPFLARTGPASRRW